jgi:peptidoglycan/LPS O-acetylase OafA/YrhL
MSKLENIQSLRAVAALLVVADHVLMVIGGHGIPVEPLTSFANFLGNQGVGVFFVISGFIMAYTTQDKFGSAANAFGFWRKRIVRIVPLYWLVTAAAVAMTVVGLWDRPFPITADRVLKSLLFMPYADGPGPMRPILGQGWTLNYEMLFYAIFGLGLLAPKRIGVPLILGLLGVVVGGGALAFPVLAGEEPRTALETLSHPILLLFAGGAILGWIYAGGSRFAVPAALPLALLSLGVAVAVFGLGLAGHPIPPVWQALFWPLNVLAVAACVFGPREDRPWLEALGNASYSLYLTHFFVVLVAVKAWSFVAYQAPWLFAAFTFMATVPVALAVYRWIETPLTNALSAKRTAVVALSTP